ncbi:MAG: glycosyltransferase [Anaerovoracaceae bacterium]|jgi:glucosyltransferase
MEMISVVVPCYNEADTIDLFYKAVIRQARLLENYEFEFIFVDDGSSDSTLVKLRALAREDERVRYLSFSRNFGKESAMLAGFRASRGDYILTMDADLQDPPDMIPDMLSAVVNEGYDCAAARRVTREGESAVRSFFARRFYSIMDRISIVKLAQGERDFRIMTRKYLDDVLKLCEHNRFSKGIFAWVGYETKWFEYKNIKRSAGTSSWSFKNLFKYAVQGIISFSSFPVILPAYIGTVTGLFSIVMAVVLLVLTFTSSVNPLLWIVCLVIFLASLVLGFQGMLGAYISQALDEDRNRPQYLVRETDEELKKDRTVS